MQSMRRLLLATLLLAGARGAPRESARQREKRRKRIMEGLSDFERSRITELHASGLAPEHINIHLGLHKSAGYVKEVVDALKIDKPSKQRYMPPKRNKAKPTPRPAPRDRAAEHRERNRERKRRREL